MRNRFERAMQFFHLESWFRLLVLCVFVGLAAGLGALLFDKALFFIEENLLRGWLFKNSDTTFWALAAVPAAGGALAGGIAIWLAPEATGHGTDSVIRAFHRQKGWIHARVPLVKGFCSILTIGSGGSAGKEGPIAEIGAGFGSTLATVLQLSIRDRRILMLAGVAGGIGAIFKAPLGGALFAAEVLYREPDFEHDAVIPGVISSVTAYSIFTAFDGYDRILQFKDSQGVNVLPTFPSVGGSTVAELLHYAVLSLLCALVAFLFVKGLRVIEHHVFRPLPVPRITKPALGGLLLGVLTISLMLSVGQLQPPDHQVFGTSHPEHIMGGGHSYLQSVLNSALDTAEINPWDSFKLAGFLGVVVLAKILATGFTIGSGGSGGVLFPSLFLGGITGATYAKLMRAVNDAGWMPNHLAISAEARAGMILVGMGGVFAACTKTPIASLVLVSEITGSYGLVVPLMMTCASAYILSRSFTINQEQVPGIADSPAHRGEFLNNVLEDIKVADAIIDHHGPETISADTPFRKVLERIKDSTASVYPIVDDEGFLVGVFSLGDIRHIMNEQSVANLVVAGDLGRTDVATVTPDTTLNEALKIFTQKNIDELPVVALDNPDESASRTSVSAPIRRPRGAAGTKRVIAMLSRRDLITAYHRRLHAIQAADDQENKGSNVFVDALEAGLLPEAIVGNEERVKPNSPMTAPPRDAAAPEPELLDEPPDDSTLRKSDY